jgi:DNA-binding IclR family transcriptional regulator
MRDDDGSKHVARTLRALELLSKRPLSQAELARELGIHPRTARRLLNSLVAEGYATRGTSAVRREFATTSKLVSLAGHITERLDLVRVAAPFVSRLASRTGEAAYLCVVSEDSVVRVLEEGGDTPFSLRPQLGTRLPLHASATGRAALAFSPARLARALDRVASEPSEGSDPAELLVELASVRERGYAVDDVRDDLETRSIGAPVFDHTGRVAGGLGLSAPTRRLPDERVREIAASVVDAARSLSEALGFDRARLEQRADGELVGWPSG